MLCEPWERGPLEKLWRLIVPWKPLPMPDPCDLDLVAGLEHLDRHRLALDGAVDGAPEFDDRPVCSDAEAPQMAELRTGQLPVGDLVECQLHCRRTRRCRRLHLHDRARAGRDHGDRR